MPGDKRRKMTAEEAEFARNLHANMLSAMKQNGWGITKFCEASGLPRSTVTPIYNGETLPNCMTLHKIAQTMNMTMSQAVGEETDDRRGTWSETVSMIAKADPEVKVSLDVLGRALADGLSLRAGKECITGKGKKAKKIRCVETGEVFQSIKDAAEHMGASRNYIAEAAGTGRAVKGFHYEFV